MKAGVCFRFALILLTGLLSQAGPAQQSAVSQSPVFEIELPELSLPPTSSRELVIPSPNITTIVAHVLNPHAERIDYGQIFTKINGESSGPIQTIVQGERGKRVQLQLKRLPGFDLIPGRNTVEVWATNRLGRAFYSAFVLRTETENRNQDFRYDVKIAGQSLRTRARHSPACFAKEPDRAIHRGGDRRQQGRPRADRWHRCRAQAGS
jgi:hypothetical protein